MITYISQQVTNYHDIKNITTIRHDTIRYGIFTCAQKLPYGQLNLAHGTETKNKKKTKNKNRVAQKKLLGLTSHYTLQTVNTESVKPGPR